MNSANHDPAVVHINGHMTLEERRAALHLMAKGIRNVDMPVTRAICLGARVQTHDNYPSMGDITLYAHEGRVTARRLPAERSGWISSAGARRFESSFSGSADRATGILQGTASSDIKRANRLTLFSSIFIGLAIGTGIAIGERTIWKFSYGLAIFFMLLLLGWITDKREAKKIIPDLERIAALAEGKVPLHRITWKATSWEEYEERRQRRRERRGRPLDNNPHQGDGPEI